MTGTPLPAWLATLENGALAEVLAARPDVCGPAEPDGLGDLAERLQQRKSVEQALKRLRRPCVQVAETAAALGHDATRTRITAVLGGPGNAVDDALTALERHALVWPGHGGVLHVAEALRERWPTRHEAASRAAFDPFPPGLPTAPVDPERVERAAAARLGEFVEHAARILAECASRPLQVFKMGGLQPKALERVTRTARCDEASARLALACAQRAGLLAVDGTHIRLSPEGDAFTFLPPNEQAGRLLLAWWRLPSTPTRTRSDDGKQLYPLSARADCAGCVQVRHELVRVLREVPEGQGARAPRDLARTLDWHRPLACDHSSGQPPHSALLGEAVLLGLVAHGALSSFAADIDAPSGHVPPLGLQEVPATCVFHSADTEPLARAVRHPALQGLGVRLLAPGVLVATGPRESVLAALRAAGYAVAEDPVRGPLPPLASDEPPPDFAALAERLREAPHVPRTRTRPAAPRPSRPSRQLSALERAQRVITRSARELRSDEIRLLARAVAENGRVRITYVDLNGEVTERVIGPPYEQVQLRRGKMLKAICEMRSAETGRPEERQFHYSRIQSVEAVDD